MKRTWTIIGVANVAHSLSWYQTLLGLPMSTPAHEYWGQVIDADGTVLLCLHQWDDHGHPSLSDPAKHVPGHGLLLFFRVDNYESCLAAARALVDRFDEEPHRNPNTETMEFGVRDPDGYFVSISALA
jgi:catechol 2,3-dioxygenase-like lactoylglutathione lyase family enzyme